MFKMFLDDIRDVSYLGPFGKHPEDWSIARSFDEAVKIVKSHRRIPDYISFDHDLGFDSFKKEKTGYDFAKWIIDMDMDGTYKIPDNFRYFIHSSNPVGKENIDMLFQSYFKSINFYDR